MYKQNLKVMSFLNLFSVSFLNGSFRKPQAKLVTYIHIIKHILQLWLEPMWIHILSTAREISASASIVVSLFFPSLRGENIDLAHYEHSGEVKPLTIQNLWPRVFAATFHSQFSETIEGIKLMLPEHGRYGLHRSSLRQLVVIIVDSVASDRTKLPSISGCNDIETTKGSF